MTPEQQAATALMRRWRQDPVAFVRECLRVEDLDPWQVEVLRAFPHQNRIAEMACKGPGKTATLAWLGWNFLLTRPHAKVPCTSITGDNLDDGLWAEFSKWQKRSPILMRSFEWTKTRIYAREHPETWFASARTWPRDADPEAQANTLAGLHADYLCFLIDEVSDIPDGVVAAAEAALMSGIETKLVIAGNCTRTEGPLYRATMLDRHLWFVVRITGDPDDPKRSPRIDITEARQQIAKYGRDSYVVRVNILGLFPERQADKLIDMAECDRAQRRTLHEAMIRHEPIVLGVDVARFGDDSSVICRRQGRVLFPVTPYRGLDVVELAEQVMIAMDKYSADGVFVDEGGIGAGVVDVCNSRGYRVSGINFGSNAMAEERFENRRTEMYWNAAEWVRSGGCLPSDPMLATELSAPRYWYDKRQRVCLEDSKSVKARLGRSPDRASSFVLTFASPVRAKPRFEGRAPDQRTGAVVEYNPFARSA